MALFWQKGGKKEEAMKPEKTVQKTAAKTPAKIERPEKRLPVKTESQAEKRTAAIAGGVTFPKGSAVIRSHITEKTGELSQKGVYTFEVKKEVNAGEIAAAIKSVYKVTPVRVSVAPIRSKVVRARGKRGRTVSGKKAYVRVKEGEKIEFI